MNPNFWSLLHVESAVEKTFTDWKISPDCQRQLQSAATDTFTFRLDGLNIDSARPFEVNDTCIIKRNGVRFFYGRVTRNSVSGQASGESISYVLEGPWWWLDHLVYQQDWIISTNYLLTGTLLVTERSPRIILFQDIIITYATPPYVASVVAQPMSVGEQIRRILQYAIDQGAPFQIGTIDPAEVKPAFSEVRDATCGELVRSCLRWIPDCVVWFDYSTEVPTINIRPRDGSIASVSVPMTGDPTGSLTVTPRHDLKVSGVKLVYESTNTLNDMSWVVKTVDSAGDVSESSLQVVRCSIQLSGSSVTVQYQKVSITAVDITDRPFWESVLPWLKQATGVAIANVRVNNALVFGQTADASDATTKYDQFGAKDITNDLQTFTGTPQSIQNLLTSGQVPHWLADDFSDATVTAKLSYTLDDPDTGAKEVKVKVPFTHKVKRTTLDATSGEQQLQNVTSATPAEAVPTGVAAAYYASASVLHYEGDYSMTEDEVTGTVGIGSKLNISGGPAEWATMDALVQSVTEQLGQGHTTVHFGPPLHLSAQDFIELQRVQRQRIPSYRLQERQDGRAYGNGSSVIGAVQTPQATPTASTVPGKELVVATKTTDTNAILKASFVVAGKTREVVIDTGALVALAASNSNIPDTFTIALKEWDVCVEGVSKKAVFVSSEPYDPP